MAINDFIGDLKTPFPRLLDCVSGSLSRQAGRVQCCVRAGSRYEKEVQPVVAAPLCLGRSFYSTPKSNIMSLHRSGLSALGGAIKAPVSVKGLPC